jgi:hypothetical protein
MLEISQAKHIIKVEMTKYKLATWHEKFLRTLSPTLEFLQNAESRLVDRILL